MRARFIAAMACAAAFAGAPAADAFAGSLQLSPLRVGLTPARPISAMTVTNGGETAIHVQAEILEWRQEEGHDVYRPTREVLVNPVIFRLAPKGTQIVRMGLQVPAAEVERSYRIFVQELPEQDAAPGVDSAASEGGPRMRTLLRLGVPVFVPAAAPRVEARWSVRPPASPGGAPSLMLANAGTTHIQLTRVVVRRADGQELLRAPLSFYVLPGRAAALPLRLPPLVPDSPDSLLRIEPSADTPEPLPAASLALPRADSPSR